MFATEKGLKLADQAMTALVSGSPLSEMKNSLSETERNKLAQLCEKLLIDFEDR